MDHPKSGNAFLESLLNKTLRIHTTDARMFIGDFKCTDNECNIILSRTHEYRRPTSKAVVKAIIEKQESRDDRGTEHGPADTIKADMNSRFMGLVVVPGQHITKIEVEE
ncbi:hypothetical protein MMC25_000101 [Agyrium rufum]|nr:hypothetical protein [Agyrium rufum]